MVDGSSYHITVSIMIKRVQYVLVPKGRLVMYKYCTAETCMISQEDPMFRGT